MAAGAASMSLCLERLDQLIAKSELRSVPTDRRAIGKAVLTDNEPWSVEVSGGVAGQRAFLRSRAAIRVIVAGRQSGKAQPLDEPVLTPTGWRPIGELEVGDEVIAGDGSVTRVTGVYDRGRLPIYKVTFDDGASTRCCGEHLWRVQTRNDRRRDLGWSVLSLDEIRDRWGEEPVSAQRVRIPVFERAETSARDLPLPPYLVGALIGDGSLTQGARLSNGDAEVVARCVSLLPEGVQAIKHKGVDYRLVMAKRGQSNPLINALRQIGLMGCKSREKHIPADYLNGSHEQRLELLRGLMDTDGTCGKTGHATFSSTSERLALDLQQLVRSLGGKAKVRSRETSCPYKGRQVPCSSFRVTVRLPFANPFSLPRKAERWKRPTSTPDERILYRIEGAGDAECRCIAVEHPEHTYVTRDYIVTHNTHQAAEEVVRICLERPNTESCVLMPSYKSTKGALRHLRRALKHVHGWVWREVDKLFLFPNGAKLYLRTSDDKSGVPTRGLTIDGVLWVDEASFVAKSAWEAAQATQAAVRDPLTIVTTTPRGRKSWVFKLCQEAAKDPDVEYFRFRTTDSPYHHPGYVARMVRQFGKKRADEELNAVFVGGSRQPFQPDDVSAAFKRGDGIYPRGKQRSIGLDVAKARDYTCAVLMNEDDEAWVLDRFRADRDESGKQDPRFYGRVVARMAALAEEHEAIVVVDEQRGGGAGAAVADLLTAKLGEERVYRVKTGNPRLKAKLIEELIADFETGEIVLGEGPHKEKLREELVFFPPAEEIEKDGIVERVYKGPSDEDRADGDEGDEDEGLHDDTVTGLYLARHGAKHVWDKLADDPLDADFSGFLGQASSFNSSLLPSHDQPSGGNPTSDGPDWGESLDAFTL